MRLSPGTEVRVPVDDSNAARGREEPLRVVARLLLSLGIAGGACLAVAGSSYGRTLSGPLTITGYPAYADFDANHYLVIYYLIGGLLPLATLACYLLLARFGPLAAPRSRRARDRDGATPTLNLAPEESPASRRLAQLGRAGVLGAVLGLEVAIIVPLNGSAIPLAVGIGVLFLAALSVFAGEVLGVDRGPYLELLAALCGIGLLYAISERTVVVVSPGDEVVHYRFFPWWLALSAGACFCAVVAARLVGGRRPAQIARSVVTFFVVPLALFLLIAAVPGPMGKMDAFSEGEYLGGSYLLLHGALPWRDVYLIHGLLADGLKPLVGYGLFGMTRWGAFAGILFVWAPAYWIATYLFAAITFGRRWAAPTATAAAIALGVFASWDIRYLFWPLVLAIVPVVLRRGSWRVAAPLGASVLALGILVPEMLYASIAVVVVLAAYECYERPRGRLRVRDFPRSLGALGAMAGLGVGFLAWLAAVGGLGGFVGYFSDFATAHTLSGGVPLFTDYSVPPRRDTLFIEHFRTQDLGLLTRYPLELVLPVAAVLVAFALVATRLVRRERLYVEDWVTICAGLLTALYYPQALSRADAGHIAASFAAAVPLLVCLAARGVFFLDERLRVACARAGTSGARRARLLRALVARLAHLSSPAGLAAVVAIVVLAPNSLVSVLEAAPSHFRVTASAPPPPAVAGAGGLGYEVDALPNGLVSDLEALIRTYAGPSRAVFDFTNAPGLFDFLLGAPPASRFYDINLTITEGAQDQAVADLGASRPRLVVFGGEVGLPRWDFLENEVRDHIVAYYLLTHYRPLVQVNDELIFIADWVHDPPPLPHLQSRPRTTNLYDTGRACAFGYIPDLFAAPSTAGAVHVPLTPAPVSTRVFRGREYKLVLPEAPSSYRYLVLTRSKAVYPGSLSVSNLRIRSQRDVAWVVSAGRTTTAVEAGACLQWYGFGKTLYVRYRGPGVLTGASLVP